MSDNLELLESLIKEQKWDEAITNLGQMKNLPKDVYLFNMGQVYFYKQDWLLARVHYELAMNEGFTSPQLVENIAQVKDNLNVTYIEAGRSSHDSLFNTLTSPYMDIVFIIPLIFLIFAVYKMRSLSKSILLSFFYIISSYGVKVWYTGSLKTALINSDVALHPAPSEALPSEMRLPMGLKVIIDDINKDYFHVVAPLEFQGWVKIQNVSLISD